jgi:hypothetical protein
LPKKLPTAERDAPPERYARLMPDGVAKAGELFAAWLGRG